MRSTVDLARLPYTFAVNRLLMPDKFLSELRDRGLHLDRHALEALHQTRLLVPLLRLRRDGRAIAAVHRRDAHAAYHLARWQPTSRGDIDEAAANSRLFDPAAEQFRSRRRLERLLGDLKYETSVYLYSPQQLIHAPIVREARPSLSLRRRGDTWVGLLAAHDVWTKRWVAQSARLREITTAVVALEPIYYSQVIGVLRLDSGRVGDWDQYAERYYAWRRKLPLGRMLRWLGVNGRWLEEAAGELLRLADLHDPLGSWTELLAHANPDQWTKLRGQARSAVDLRIAAEVMLRYHDDLVEGGRAKPLPEPDGRFRDPFASRLERRRPLDEVLTDFGLSPHPRVVLVVEGASEQLLFPRVMDTFGIRTEEDFIAIQDAGGVGRDLAPLIAYLAPRLGEQQDRYVELLRPPTRILVVLDAEGPVATAEQREKRRQRWVDRLMQTLPRELQQDAARAKVIRQQLEFLVEISTWKRSGESFEFAHFTDRQIARAINRLDSRQRKPTFEKLVELVAGTRAWRANLDELLHGVSKLDLADELWPLLERRLVRSRESPNLRRIPIVRVLDRALELAHQFGRGRVVLALEPTPRARRRRRRRQR